MVASEHRDSPINTAPSPGDCSQPDWDQDSDEMHIPLPISLYQLRSLITLVCDFNSDVHNGALFFRN